MHNGMHQYVKVTDLESSQTISKIVYNDDNAQGGQNLVSYILMPTEGLQQPSPYIEMKLPTFDKSGGSCAWTKDFILNANGDGFALENQFSGDEFGSILMVGDQQYMSAHDDDNAVEKFYEMLDNVFTQYPSMNDFKLNMYYVGQYGLNDIRYDHLYRCN